MFIKWPLNDNPKAYDHKRCANTVQDSFLSIQATQT